MRSIVTAAPVCPSCLFATASRALLVPNARIPWIVGQHRFLSGSENRPWARRSSPARMVLSDRDRVARSPSKRDGQQGQGRAGNTRGPVSQRRSAGPFGGMNQTHADIRERPSSSRAPSRTSSRSDAAHGGRDRGENRERKSSQQDNRRTKAMKMQGSLKTIPYGQRTRTKAGMGDIESFDQFALLPSLKEAVSNEILKGMVDIKPTPVQRLAIPALLGQGGAKRRRSGTVSDDAQPARTEFLLAAETGSGKTLAYLLPVIHAMKEAEAADPAIAAYREYFEKQAAAMKEPDFTGPREFEPHPTAARPRVIVLVPTAELVDQVGSVAKSLSHVAKFKASLYSANLSAKVIEANMYNPRGIDVVVATPHLLSSMADSDPNILSRVSHLVVDEADSLFDRSFSSVTTSILDRALPSMKQLILCSATIPKRLDNYLVSQFPDMTRITTPNLHAIPRRVQLGVVDVSKDPYRNNKNLACADAIWSIGKDAARHEDGAFRGGESGEMDVKRIMVFVNEREKTQEVAEFLISKGIDAVALHRDTPEQRQSEMLGSFTTTEPMKTKLEPAPSSPNPFQASSPPVNKGRRHLPNTKIIVATDLASRGIDTLAVRHVILYDVPHTTIDFIHRLGRAGRMGRRGRGIVLLGRDDRRDIVAEVRESMYMGQALI